MRVSHQYFTIRGFDILPRLDALVEDLLRIVRPSRSHWPRFSVRQTEVSRGLTEMIRTGLDAEFFPEKMLNLL